MSAFVSDPSLVWEWYNWRRQLIREVAPNAGHYALGKLESLFDSFTLVTQNVDGLHRLAGSTNILELHGNINRSRCVHCGTPAPEGIEIDPGNIACCEKCGGKYRPDVVWFGEMLNSDVISAAFAASEAAELFLSIGTSAVVHPAASLPVVAKRGGATLVEINPDRTPLSELADFYFAAKSGEFLPGLIEEFEARRTDP